MAFTHYPPGTRTKRARGRDYPNKKWIVRFRFRGERFEIRTDARNEKEAESEALEFIHGFTDERGPAPGTVNQVIEAYKAGRRPAAEDQANLDAVAGEIGGLVAETIGQAEFDRCCAVIYPGRTNATWNRHIFTPLIAALNYSGIALRDADGRPVRIKRPRLRAIEDQPYESLDRRQREILIAEARAMADRDLETLLCLWCLDGLRITESIELRRRDRPGLPYADIECGVIKTIQRKGGVERVHWRAMHARTRQTLSRCDGGEDDRFIRWKTRWGPRRAIEVLEKRTGIRFHPHMGRHTFGDQAMAQGASLRDMMDAGGWRSAQAAMRYTHRNVDRQRALKKRI